MKQAINSFYEQLYTPDTVIPENIEFFTNNIPVSDRLDNSTHENICAPFTVDELIAGASRHKAHSSPGIDGLPYQLIKLILSHEKTFKIGVSIYNQALQEARFPSSWQETCLVLLPKKGDLSLLQNWRPISLINTDAKIFTRILNARLMTHLCDGISTMQMGFMKGRFIGDHGMTMNCIQAIATDRTLDTVGLCLDQEKAYDRIHFDYLRATMEAFNIPSTAIDSIITLFSNTSIRTNMNGFITSPIVQKRGLRQGDPISPLLFNIAFDPFLRAIQNNRQITGFDPTKYLHEKHTPSVDELSFSMNSLSLSNASNDDKQQAPIKALAYADDTMVILLHPFEFYALQDIIGKYMHASNASLNYHKTSALSLPGRPLSFWSNFLSYNGISKWHDKNSPEPFMYLGYPLCSFYANHMIQKTNQLCTLFKSRNLTMRGRVTVSNTLILSKWWHSLRLFSLTKSQQQSIQSLLASFINNNSKITRFSYQHLTIPLKHGGLGLLDLNHQINSLQWKWLYPLLMPDIQPHPAQPSLSTLKHTLNYFMSSPEYPTYQWSLLFPACRPSFKKYLNPITNILRATDSISRNFLFCSPERSVCLALPITELFIQSLPPEHLHFNTFVSPLQWFKDFPSSINKITGNTIFTITTNAHSHPFLQIRRDFSFLLDHHALICNDIIQAIENNQLILNNFVLSHMLPTSLSTPVSVSPHPSNPLHSFLQAFICPPNPSPFRKNSGYKNLPHIDKKHLHTTLILSDSSRWKLFWSLQIALNARNA